MEYRELGKSNVKVTPLAFGAWAIGGWMWGGADKEDAISAIQSSIDLGITLAQLVLGWTIHQPGITVTIVGARDTEQVEENVKALEIKLTNEEMDFIRSHLEKLELSI